MISPSRHNPCKINDTTVLYVRIIQVSDKHSSFPRDSFHTLMPWLLKQSKTNLHVGGRFWNPRVTVQFLQIVTEIPPISSCKPTLPFITETEIVFPQISPFISSSPGNSSTRSNTLKKYYFFNIKHSSKIYQYSIDGNQCCGAMCLDFHAAHYHSYCLRFL